MSPDPNQRSLGDDSRPRTKQTADQNELRHTISAPNQRFLFNVGPVSDCNLVFELGNVSVPPHTITVSKLTMIFRVE